MSVQISGPGGQRIPRGLIILTTFAMATITIMGLKSVAGILGPVVLALVLVITASPITGYVERLGAPRWLAALATVVTVYLILIAMIIALVVSVARLADIVTEYAPQANDLINQSATKLADLGVDSAQIQRITSALDFGKLFSLATDLLSGILSVLTNLFLIAALALFIGFDAAKFPEILQRAAEDRPQVVSAMRSFAQGTRRYFAVSAAFGLIVAILDTAALYWMGIAGAVVWGVLAFVTNFIPNIGFVIGLVPPALLGLLDNGLAGFIAVIAVYSVLNVVIQTIIQPKIVGDAIGLSATVTFVSLMFWAWVLGALGALLAIPMTLLSKALLIDVDPETQWAIPLISGKHAPGLTPQPDPAAD
jgi:predicted PurR-regulated permease PerM